MYDAGTRPEGYLREYADEFRSVEIDSMYHWIPPNFFGYDPRLAPYRHDAAKAKALGL